jgi:hypothetical protein
MSYTIKNGAIEYNGIETKIPDMDHRSQMNIRFYPVSRIFILGTDKFLHLFRDGRELRMSPEIHRYCVWGVCEIDDDRFVISYSGGVVLVTISTMTLIGLNIDVQCTISFLNNELAVVNSTTVQVFRLDLSSQTVSLVRSSPRSTENRGRVLFLDEYDRYLRIDVENQDRRCISIINANNVTELPNPQNLVFSTSADRSRFAYLETRTRVLVYSSTGELLFSQDTQEPIYLIQFNVDSLIYYTSSNITSELSARIMHTVLPDYTVVDEILPNGVYAVIPETGNILL